MTEAKASWTFQADAPRQLAPGESAWTGWVWQLSRQDGAVASVAVLVTPEAEEAGRLGAGIVEDSLLAIESQGRSAVEPFLDDREPPERLEIRTQGIVLLG